MRLTMRDLPILYSFRRCPYAIRARLALLVSGTRFVHREILLRDKPTALLVASPKGTVPVLILTDGTVVDESIDIMRGALSQHDPEGWLRRADAALVETFDSKFKHHLDRYKYPERYDVDPLVHRAAGLAMLTELDERLAEQHYLDGAKRGFSDIAIVPFVRQFAGVDPSWFAAHGPRRVCEWLAKLVASDLFEQAMVKVTPWVETTR